MTVPRAALPGEAPRAPGAPTPRPEAPACPTPGHEAAHAAGSAAGHGDPCARGEVRRRGAASERGLHQAPRMDSHRSDGSSRMDPGLHPLFAALRRQASANGDPLTLRAWLERAEAWRILDALREASGNRSAAAR